MIKINKVEFSKISKNDIKAWNFVLENSNNATIFHTPEWIFLMVDKIGVEGEILIAYDNENPIGIFPYYLKKGKLFSKKSTTGSFETPYGGPIKINKSKENTIVELLKKQEESLVIVKSKVIVPPFTNIDSFKLQNFKFVEKGAIVLDLELSEDDLYMQLYKMKKRNIKKAIKNNIKIVSSNSNQLFEFHEMIKDTYKRLELTAPKSIDFYSKLMDSLFSLNRVKLLIAYLDDKPIASAIYLLYKNTIIFWQGAAYREYMKFGVNDLLHWEIIKYGKNNGFNNYNLLHFHDDMGNELEQLKKFKEGFGGVLTPYYSFDKEFNLNSKLKHII